MKRDEKGKVAWVQIPRSLLQRRKADFDLSEEILSLARAIKNVEVCVLFKESILKKDEIRVNFRSQGATDVNKIAARFGGGGHKTASGATVRGTLDSVTKKVLAEIKKNLK